MNIKLIKDLHFALIIGIFSGVNLQIPVAHSEGRSHKITEEEKIAELQDQIGKRISYNATGAFNKILDEEVKDCKSVHCFYQSMNKYANLAKLSYKTAFEQLYPSVGNSASVREYLDTLVKKCSGGKGNGDFLEVISCQVSGTLEIVKLLESIKEHHKANKLNVDYRKTEYPFLKTILAATCGTDYSNDCFWKNVDALILQGETSMASMFDSYKNSLKVSHIGAICGNFKGAEGAVFDCAVPATGHQTWADFITGKSKEGKIQFIAYSPKIQLYFSPARKKPAPKGSEIPLPPPVPILNDGKFAFMCPDFLQSIKVMKPHTGARGDLFKPFHFRPQQIEIQKTCMEYLEDYFTPFESLSDSNHNSSHQSAPVKSNEYKILSGFLKSNDLGKLVESKPNACHHWYVDVDKGKSLEEMLKEVNLEKLTPTDRVYPMLYKSMNLIQSDTELDMGKFALLRQSEMILFSMMQTNPEIIFKDDQWENAYNKVDLATSCIISEDKVQSRLFMEKAREELKVKLPFKSFELVDKWVGGLKTVAKEMKLIGGILNTTKQTMADVHCVAKTPNEARLNLTYNYHGTVSGSFETAASEVHLARINALERLATLTKKEVSSYVDKEGNTTCFQVRQAVKDAKGLFDASAANEPLLMKKSKFSRDGVKFSGTLLDLLNEPQFEKYQKYKNDFTINVAKEVSTSSLERMTGICSKGNSGLIAEGHRLSTTDGMLKTYISCEDLKGNQKLCEERLSTGWLLCRNYHVAYADMKDNQYWAMWKTAGLTAGIVLAIVASIPTLGGSVALAAAIGLPLGVYLTADEILEWQKERAKAPGKQDDFIIQKWGSLEEFQKSAEKMDKSQFEFISTTIAINAALMAFDAVALLKYANNIRKAASLVERTRAIKAMMGAEEFKGAFSLFAKNAEELAIKPMAELKGPIANFLQKTGAEGEKHVEALRKILSHQNFYGPVVNTLSKDDVLLLSLVEERLNNLKSTKGLSAVEIERAREQILSAITSCTVQ